MKTNNNAANDINKKAMEYAKASLAMEGLIVSEKQEKLVKDALEGKINNAEFIKRMKLLANG